MSTALGHPPSVNDRIILDKRVDGYRIIAVRLDPKEIEELLPSGEARMKTIVRDFCGEGKTREQCMEEIEGYIGTPLDYAIAEYLSRILGYDVTPTEEVGYGLPEFSVYKNYDARSYSGRWGYVYGDKYSSTLDVLSTGLFWALVPEEKPAFNKLADIVEDIINKHKYVAVVVLRD